MECVSTWPLLQRNKIEDSKINVAIQAIADVPIQEGEAAAAGTPVKSDEEISKLQEVKVEPSEYTDPESTETHVDHAQAVDKSENAEPIDELAPTEPSNGVTPMAVDEKNLQPGRGRAPERHESQIMRLKRLATKVLIPQPTPSRC